ncbi:hypothetical protein [Sinorhizobium sp. KGO-5]|uniref:hypothetical protein n=1 Tax=Sinorhizobium sp. KGO-5 TaxID=1470810 RepID=UPI0030C72D8A
MRSSQARMSVLTPPSNFLMAASVCSPIWPSSRAPTTFCSDFTARRSGVHGEIEDG